MKSLLLAAIFSLTSISQGATELALNWKAEPQFGGFYAADLHGLYKKNGLDVKVLEGGAGTPVVQMVATGKVPFGIVSADEVIISQSKGSDVVALFAVYQTNPQGIMVHEEKGYKKIGDLFKSNDTLALQKGLPYAMYLMKKYPKAAVKMVPYQGGIGNFLQDKNFAQQCFVTSEPLAAQKANAKIKTFLVADEGYNPYTTVLVTRASYLAKDEKTVKAMVQAVREGWKQYLENPEATNRHMMKLNPAMDAQTFKESAAAQKSLIETKALLGSMTEERWKQLGEQLQSIGVVKTVPLNKNLFRNL